MAKKYNLYFPMVLEVIMKFFKLITLVIALFFSHLDGVGMSPLAFKNVNKFFKSGFEYNSPIFGCVALNTGVIENLRFYNVAPSYKVDGKRDFINDKIPCNDPIMEMIKILFPSPVGLLASETSSSQNFGRYCGPEHVASLINFCHKIRTFFIKNSMTKLPKSFGKALVRLGFNDENVEIFTQDPFGKTPKSRLLKNIMLAIQNELRVFDHENAMSGYKALSEAKFFYPKYFPEQIITAFFCHKFADQNDIKKFLNALSLDIVNADMILNINTLIDRPFSIEDLELVLSKRAPFSGDDLWLILNREEFFRVLPYRSGKPISNGLAQLYDRSADRLSDDPKASFPDCVEATLRHIINLFLYDADTRSFNFSHLNSYLNGRQRVIDYSKNLKHFYGFFDHDDMNVDTYVVQTPDKANAGSELIRSAWNRVVADLKNPRILYSRTFGSEENTNELYGTMLNLCGVINTIFDLDLEPDPKYEEGKNDIFQQATLMLVSDCFKKLCKVLNPNLKCEIDFSNVCISEFNQKKDVAGNVHIAVFKGSEELFKFNLLADCHSEIVSLNITRKDVPEIPQWAVNWLKSTNKNNSIYESLVSLDDQSSEKSPISIYKLLGKTIDDPDSAVQSLTLISQVPLQHTRLIVKNILKNFLWEDPTAIQKISPVIRKIYYNNHELFDCLKDFVLGFALEDGDSAEFISQFQNLKYLICSETNQIRDLIIPDGMVFLEVIYLYNSVVRKVTLAPAPKLRTIYLGSTKNLEELVIPVGMDSLEEINLSFSGVRKVTFSAAPKLKIIDVICTSNLEELIISGEMNSLEKIDLSKSGVRKVTLADLPKLKLMNLENTRNLVELVIPIGMDLLENINLCSSGVKKVALVDAPKLKLINLNGTKNLVDLEITGNMDSLESINLSYSKVRKVTISAAPRLKLINFDHTENLEELVIPVGMYSLKKINLCLSGVKKVSLVDAPKLKLINLEHTMNLDELVIHGGLDSLEEIDLSHSGVKNVNLSFVPKLNKIDLSYSKVKKVILTAAPCLNKIDLFAAVYLYELVIPEGMYSLEYINISHSGVRNIILSASPQLKEIYCEDRDIFGTIKIIGVDLCPLLDKEKLLKFAIIENDESESRKRKRCEEEGPEKRLKHEENNDIDIE